jgi:DNA helicase-2/ATP-dependent DNA helicase PcrA
MGEKKLIHAVAGSGKTKMLIDDIDISRRNLLITYTEANQNTLKQRLIQRFGCIPENTFVFGLFEFLYSFCLKPYSERKINGIDFNYHNNGIYDNKIYNNDRIIHYQLSREILKNREDHIDRINKFFDCIYIDECQDFSSDDFDWLLNLSKINGKLFLFGDFYQKTFSTSNRGSKGKGIHSDFSIWKSKFSNFIIDETSLSKSYRCPKNITHFIQSSLGIVINTHESNQYDSEIKLVSDVNHIDKIMNDPLITKLFYQNSKKYSGNCLNWGESKGLEFDNVCVILNKTTFEKYKNADLKNLESSTKSKFYVACSRAQKNLYFIEEKMLSSYKLG